MLPSTLNPITLAKLFEKAHRLDANREVVIDILTKGTESPFWAQANRDGLALDIAGLCSVIDELQLGSGKPAMRRVIVESPFAGKTPELTERNKRYARAAMKDCLLRGEAPYASHLLYTQDGVLDDTKPEERALGIEAGLIWGKLADMSVVYVDLGISGGMKQGIERAEKEGRPYVERTLPGWAERDAA